MSRSTWGTVENTTRLRLRDSHVGPDALVWVAGRQPGGSLLRASRPTNCQVVIVLLCFRPTRRRWWDIIPEAELRSAGQTGASAPTPTWSRVLSKQEQPKHACLGALGTLINYPLPFEVVTENLQPRDNSLTSANPLSMYAFFDKAEASDQNCTVAGESVRCPVPNNFCFERLMAGWFNSPQETG